MLKRYMQMAKDMGMAHAVVLAPQQVFFDPRAILKCRWGCEYKNPPDVKCQVRGTSQRERMDMLNSYQRILLVHSHDAHQVSRAVLELERQAFLDGNHFAFAIRYCRWCTECAVDQGGDCAFPEKVRPCDQAFGIDVFRTVRGVGLPIQVLQSKEDIQNRYGFVLID